MFTGIVEEIGKIKELKKTSKSMVITIEANKILEDIKIGDSIAVNGICLTVVSYGENHFVTDVMPETLNRSSLGQIKKEGLVNLERAMISNGRFGGHIVSGHIDGTGKIINIKKDSNAYWYKISASKDILKFIIEKGSITIDGISLTVAKVTNKDFSVSIIPHTLKNTILSKVKIRDIVNLEVDIVGKYVASFLKNK